MKLRSCLLLVVGTFALVGMLATVPGCGIDPEMTDAQIDKDIETKMAWVEKAAKIASANGLAYSVELNIGGRPAIGEELRLFLDTDVSMILRFHGNAASGRLPEQ